jgi:hypothetical protein
VKRGAALLRRDRRRRHGSPVAPLAPGGLGPASTVSHGPLRGVLAPASKLRPRIVPKPPATPTNDIEHSTEPKRGGSRYRPWAELLKRCFSIDVLRCPSCDGRMRLVALNTDPEQVRRFLRGTASPPTPPRGSRPADRPTGKVACCAAPLTTTTTSRRRGPWSGGRVWFVTDPRKRGSARPNANTGFDPSPEQERASRSHSPSRPSA